MVLPIASLPLSTRNRVSQILFHPTLPYLAAQSHDRSVEIFRIRTKEEVRKKQERRKKRAKEKGKDMAKVIAEDIAEDLEVDPEIKLVDLFTPFLVIHSSGKVRSFDFGPENATSKGGTQVSRTMPRTEMPRSIPLPVVDGAGTYRPGRRCTAGRERSEPAHARPRGAETCSLPSSGSSCRCSR